MSLECREADLSQGADHPKLGGLKGWRLRADVARTAVKPRINSGLLVEGVTFSATQNTGYHPPFKVYINNYRQYLQVWHLVELEDGR